MNIVSVDLELTQNPGHTPKIIQIGAVKMNTSSDKVLGGFNEITNPGELPDAFITELTGITPEQVAAARPLAEVLGDFWSWHAAQQVGWAIYQWGRGDLEALIAASTELNVPYPKRINDFNIKHFTGPFKIAKGVPIKGGLAKSMASFGLEFIGREHNAYDDAYNTGRLFCHLVTKLKTWEKRDRDREREKVRVSKLKE